MFPPKRSNDIQKVLDHLGESLTRANDNMTGETVVWTTGKGDHAAFQLKEKVSKGAERYARNYISQYLRASGWRARNIRFTGFRIEFSFEPYSGEQKASPRKNRGASSGRKKWQNRERKTTS